MGKLVLFLSMLFMHIFADYNLQGWLASAKQKEYWKKELKYDEKQFQNSQYKEDYKCALLMHSLQWTICIFVMPLIYMYITSKNMVVLSIILQFVIQTGIHYITDDLKANNRKINLWEDQIIHLVQIIILWIWVII